jgi:hypothetical protein
MSDLVFDLSPSLPINDDYADNLSVKSHASQVF